MTDMKEPGDIARRLLLRRVLGAVVLIGGSARLAAAAATAAGAAEVAIDNFSFAPTRITVKAGTTVQVPFHVLCAGYAASLQRAAA